MLAHQALSQSAQRGLEARRLTISGKHLTGFQEGRCASPAELGAAHVNQGVGMRGLTLLLRCERGANAIEYALVASLIAIAGYAAFVHLADRIDTMYGAVSNQLPSN
jgi:Flp pilus assembly pilin Flp